MLTGYQTEVVAYYPQDGGEFLCPDCAREYAGSSIVFARAERGLSNVVGLEPIIRYSLDEANGEQVYEAAEQRLLDFLEDHPMFYPLLQRGEDRRGGPSLSNWTADGYRLIDRLAERLEEAYSEHCGQCGELLG